MFVREKTSKNSDKIQVQIVENDRVDGKVVQTIVMHLGQSSDPNEIDKLKKLGNYYINFWKEEANPSLFPYSDTIDEEDKYNNLFEIQSEASHEKPVINKKAKTERLTDDDSQEENISKNIKSNKPNQVQLVNIYDLYEVERNIKGIHDVYGSLYKQLKLDTLMKDYQKRKASNEALYHMVLLRIASPNSKLESVEILREKFGIKISLDTVYRMMDNLDEDFEKRLKEHSLFLSEQLLHQKLDVVFYDCTTLYFESFTEDELKMCGFSKDLKFSQPQVVLGLLATPEGLPIGYHTFPGNIYEGNTLEIAIKNLEEKYKLNRIIFVADSAMFNKKNRAYLEGNGIRYIVGSRIKSSSKALKEKILDESNYRPSMNSGDKITISEIKLTNQRLIVSYSKKRALKDSSDRDKNLLKLMNKLSIDSSPKSFMSGNNRKKYIVVKGSEKVEIDLALIEQDARWDGLHGLITNIDDMSAEEILENYHGLWQIEDCFRVSKRDLAIRPIYHWTPKKIKAHIAISFMSLLLVRHLCYRVNLQYKKLSPEAIKKELLHSQESIIKNSSSGEKFALPSSETLHIKKLYNIVGKQYSNSIHKI